MNRNNYGNNNYGNNRGYNQAYNPIKKNYDNEESQITIISRTIDSSSDGLFDILKKEDLYLPEGKAWKIAKNLNDKTSINQVRKIYSMIKEAEDVTKTEGLERGLEKMFMIVPLTAYAFGRKLIQEDFYELIKICINNKKLKSEKDINTFSKFVESIVAYSKVDKEKK